ncbi:MAG: hypothetical protein IPP37_17175 [Saprospiraceae bacterium]|nr:hypothetical protein [Saprospiraceae bacterium]
MKKTHALILMTMLLMACGKEDESLPRDKFLGEYDLYQKNPETYRGTTAIIEGEEDNQMKWLLQDEEIGMELIGKNDTVAFGTAFTVFLLADNFASLQYINEDTLLGTRTTGTILFPSTYKSRDFVLVRR